MCRDSIIMVEVQAYTLTCNTETEGGIHYGEVYHMYLYRYQAKDDSWVLFGMDFKLQGIMYNIKR